MTSSTKKSQDVSPDNDRAVKGPITYKVSLGGREHNVVVERA